jgi:hypothetical protein
VHQADAAGRLVVDGDLGDAQVVTPPLAVGGLDPDAGELAGDGGVEELGVAADEHLPREDFGEGLADDAVAGLPEHPPAHGVDVGDPVLVVGDEEAGVEFLDGRVPGDRGEVLRAGAKERERAFERERRDEPVARDERQRHESVAEENDGNERHVRERAETEDAEGVGRHDRDRHDDEQERPFAVDVPRGHELPEEVVVRQQ